MPKQLSEAEKKRILKENHHKKIDYALEKAFLKDFDVYNLVQDFFAEFLNLNYKFTHEELVKELDKLFLEDKLKIKIINFLEKLSFMEFNSDSEPTQDELKRLILEFKEIINQLIIFQEEIHKGLFGSIIYWFKQKFRTIKPRKEVKEIKIEIPNGIEIPKHIQNENKIPVPSQPVKQTIPPQKKQPEIKNQQPKQTAVSVIQSTQSGTTRPLYNVTFLINQINQHIAAKKIPQARIFYKHLIGIYTNASPENKKKLYPIIINLHSRIK
ncbi:MAG: hypothetical protein QXG00_01350 [Candidatus Woesearchaeota archaeon]